MKQIFSLLIIFLLCMSFVLADSPIAPYSINGKASLVTGECIGNFDIKLKTINYNTLEYQEISVPVNSDCEYGFSLGNEPFSLWMSGMKIELKFCESSSCLKTIYIGQNDCPNGGGCEVNFQLESTDIVSTPQGNEPAGEQIIEKIVEVKKYVCSDGTEVDDVSQCPEGTDEWWKWALGALGLAGLCAGFIALIKYWKKKNNKRAIKMVKTALKNKGYK